MSLAVDVYRHSRLRPCQISCIENVPQCPHGSGALVGCPVYCFRAWVDPVYYVSRVAGMVCVAHWTSVVWRMYRLQCLPIIDIESAAEPTPIVEDFFHARLRLQMLLLVETKLHRSDRYVDR